MTMNSVANMTLNMVTANGCIEWDMCISKRELTMASYSARLNRTLTAARGRLRFAQHCG
jgi:hypothetical protein